MPALKAVKKSWPSEVKEVAFSGTTGTALQPALFYAPQTTVAVPLLVALHTWSGDYRQTSGIAGAEWCVEKQWCFIHPQFQGPNWTPHAMGSDLVVDDIISAVNYAKNQTKIDTNRIYLIGGSGGGHAALLMAGRMPELWAGISSWCPISDLKKWHATCKQAGHSYYKHIEAAVQSVPGQDEAADAACRQRSPVTYLKNAGGVALDISAGIHDGHNGSVPISQTLEAFNEVALPEDRLTEEDITFFTAEQNCPPALKSEGGGMLGPAEIHFRRTSGNVRVTLFEGGHVIHSLPGLEWLACQRRGSPAIWNVESQAVQDNVRPSANLQG